MKVLVSEAAANGVYTSTSRPLAPRTARPLVPIQREPSGRRTAAAAGRTMIDAPLVQLGLELVGQGRLHSGWAATVAAARLVTSSTTDSIATAARDRVFTARAAYPLCAIASVDAKSAVRSSMGQFAPHGGFDRMGPRSTRRLLVGTTSLALMVSVPSVAAAAPEVGSAAATTFSEKALPAMPRQAPNVFDLISSGQRSCRRCSGTVAGHRGCGLCHGHPKWRLEVPQ